MAYTASKLIAIAKAEIGYKEKATNANLDSKTANAGSNNWTKYGRDLGNAGYYGGSKNGYAWCDQFVDWCFLQLCGNRTAAEAMECQTGIYGAGCGFSMSYYDKQGRFDKTPKVGDQVFFRYAGTTSGADHTGIVVAVTDKQITTIEGNAGNRVQERVYNRNDSTLYGYGHPKYDAEPKKEETVYTNIPMPTISRGASGHAVKVVQRLLRVMEYHGADGKLIEIDSDFGANTEHGVKSYQRINKLPVTGVVDGATWKKMLRGI